MNPNLLLTVEELKEAEGGFGDQVTDQWEQVKEELFALKSLSGREYEQGGQMESEVTHHGRCHYFAGAHPGMRLRSKDNRLFHVVSVTNEDERNRWLAWRVKEQFNAA